MKTELGKLLSAEAVGELLSLSKRTVFRMKSAGLICSSIRVGRGAVRFRESDIRLWIEWGCHDRKTATEDGAFGRARKHPG